MSTGSPKLARREQAIEATRRRLRKLEIEAHRIKAELARLEAEYEDDVADFLSRKLRRRTPTEAIQRVDSPHTGAASGNGAAPPAVLPFANQSRTGTSRRRKFISTPRASTRNPSLPQVVAGAEDVGSPFRVTARPRTARSYRKSAPPFVLSLALHLVVLLLGVSFTFATLAQQEAQLIASPADIDDELAEEFSEVEIEPTRFDDAELQNIVDADTEFNITDTLQELEPAEVGAGPQVASDIGRLDALPSDLGSLMAGAGLAGGGEPGGPLGSAVFFGARSKGDRFVFVVDNSSSMKGGRLEAATAELLRTIDSLSQRQSFYVIFVSDKTYPLFYPVPAADLLPATAENKKRLAEWLPKAILASGNNREMIKAMDMAAALRPHAVFLLWDGDLKYSEKVRMEVMTHLTRPNQWNFTIHTLGMGIVSLDSEQNLAAIAQAHGGTYRRVDVPLNRRP